MKTVADCKSGEIVRWNGYEWIVIDHYDDTRILLMKDILENRAFDENGDYPTDNWKECSLRKYLNDDFYNKLKDKERILYYESDLIADNGDDAYGTSKDKIFLISMDFYRRHRKEISLPNGYWWTITPLSSNAHYGRLVNPGGSASNYAYDDISGVRPACLVSSSIQLEDDKTDALFPQYENGKKDMLHEIIEYCTVLLAEMGRE